MSKASKEAQAERKAMGNARRITPQMLFRLILKSLGFAILVALIMMLLNYFRLPYADTPWFQFAVMLSVYFMAYPFLMSEFRSRHSKKS